MNYKLKPLNESNVIIDVQSKKSLVTEKYKAKLNIIRAKMNQLQTEYRLTVASYQEELKKIDDEVQKSIDQNNKKNPFRNV